eukprot:897769-Prymnesium_polylepis.1
MHLVVRKQRLFADIKAREDKVGGARSPVGLCGKLDVGARTQTGKTAFLDPVRRHSTRVQNVSGGCDRSSTDLGHR